MITFFGLCGVQVRANQAWEQERLRLQALALHKRSEDGRWASRYL